MAIFYAVLCNRGTRLRGGQAARFCAAEFGSAVAPRSANSRRTEYEGSQEAIRWLVPVRVAFLVRMDTPK